MRVRSENKFLISTEPERHSVSGVPSQLGI